MEEQAWDDGVGWKQWIPFIGPSVNQAWKGDNISDIGGQKYDPDAVKNMINEIHGYIYGSTDPKTGKHTEGAIATWRSWITDEMSKQYGDMDDLVSHLSEDINDIVDLRVFKLQEWVIIVIINMSFLALVVFVMVFYYR